jgi:signal peptidase I
MNPTFQNNDVLLIDKLSYEKGDPKRFDLVVFSYQYDMKTKYIKRVIGLPKETVEIRDNKIWIDGKELDEYYGIYDNEEKNLEDWGPCTLEYNEYFVLGDNRDHSVDSRSGDVGLVKRNILIGRAAFRLWPFSDIGSLKYQ